MYLHLPPGHPHAEFNSAHCPLCTTTTTTTTTNNNNNNNNNNNIGNMVMNVTMRRVRVTTLAVHCDLSGFTIFVHIIS
jgi:hypothetical protein